MSEQRLIDANALKPTLEFYARDCRENNDETGAEIWEDCITMLDGASAVQKRGEWSKKESWFLPVLNTCNNCLYQCWGKKKQSKYCPNCGAIMEES